MQTAEIVRPVPDTKEPPHVDARNASRRKGCQPDRCKPEVGQDDARGCVRLIKRLCSKDEKPCMTYMHAHAHDGSTGDDPGHYLLIRTV